MGHFQELWHSKHTRESDLENTRFDNAEKIHDWRNHVGENTKQIWPTLDLEQRAAIALDAEDQASAEDWERTEQ